MKWLGDVPEKMKKEFESVGLFLFCFLRVVELRGLAEMDERISCGGRQDI